MNVTENWDSMVEEFKRLLSDESLECTPEFNEWFPKMRTKLENGELTEAQIEDLNSIPGVTVEESMELKFPPRPWDTKENQ